MIFSLRQIALAALMLLGALPSWSGAQVVPGGAHAPSVVQTQNGLPQVDINRPSGAGVSMNTYGQFDVQQKGAILNNSPSIVQTRQAGMINGNPNFGSGQSARVIVNQVNSSAASQINGHLEVAGQRAEVVIANGSGISVNGGGFINTSRAILTTGTPNFAPDGSLAGFNVTGGNISIQGAGLNAGDTDQVDLLSRAIQANAAIYAKNLNVVTGANSIGHDTLNVTPIAGDGPVPYVSIDVSQLGGMYANRIVLVGTENGVGVSTKGVLAAQAGDLILTTQGKLVLAGQTNASGNISLSARDGIDNSGTTYAQQNVTAGTSGALTNSGVLAAQRNTTVNAGSIASAGTLGAGVNGDGSLAPSGDLSVAAGGTLTATGRNAAGGNAALGGASVNLAGSRTSANGSLAIAASSGELNLSGATTTAGGALDTRAAGTLANDGGVLSSGGAQTATAGALSNRNGQIVSGSTLNATVAGDLSNHGGTLSGSATTLSAASIDNTDGRIDGDALSVSTSGELVNRGGRLTQYGTVSQTISAGGALDNTGGTIASNATDLGLTAQTVMNDGGTVQHAGSGAFAVNATGAVSNLAGTMASNGSLALTGARLDNTGGTLSAQRAAQVSAVAGFVNHRGTLYGRDSVSATSQGSLDNAGGSIQTAGNLMVTAGGALSNAQGVMSANGVHGMVDVSATSVDNTGGRLTSAGDGATTVSADGIANTGGTLGGNGDVTLNARTLTNNGGAQLVAGGAAKLNVTQRVNNAGGTLFGGTGLTLNQANAVVVNDSGAILGGLDVAVNAASLSNVGGAIRANRDIAAGGAMTGDGAMVAGRNLSLAVAGDYTNGAANHLHADGDMAVSATGTLTNSGTLAATGALVASGAKVVNTAGAEINSSATTVKATGTLANAGRIEGDTVTTSSATLANTGSLIGNDVTVNAIDVQNTGAAAVIAGASSVHVYAQNAVTNADGALIYSAGNLEIAKDGTRDASGMLANQTGTLINSAATIEADGDIDIAAHRVSNLRTGVVTQTGTPQDAGSNTLTAWTAGIPPGALGSHFSLTFPGWNWKTDQADYKAEIVGDLAKPLTVTVPKSQVTNLDPAAKTLSLTQPLTEEFYDNTKTVMSCDVNGLNCNPLPVLQTREIGTNPTQWYNSLTDNGDGTYSLTFWPDFDPAKNIRPDQVQVRHDLGPDSHDYTELSRTRTATKATDQLVSAGNVAIIQAQGAIRINADGGAIGNESSTMAAGGDLVRRATGGTVSDTGTVLQQTLTTDTQSTFYWHQKTGGDRDTQVVDTGIAQSTTTVDALPAIATSNQTVRTDAQTISVASVDRQGQTVTGSGVTGGSADGTQTGRISGQTANPQTVGGTNLKLPVNGLYTLYPAPDATYLVATDPRFTQYTKFISSGYMLGQLGLDPQKTQKRLGDGLYEQTLIRDQVTQLTGRTFLAGYTSNLDEYTALMNSGVAYAREFGLEPGIALTSSQMSQLTTDLVWLVSQDVTLPDGSHQTVLVPQVYLAQSGTVDLTHSGALVAGNAVKLNASGDLNNSGHVVSNLATTVLGNNIVNSGVIGSAGMTAVAAVQDVRNTSGRIGGADVIVQAGRDVMNGTATYGVSKDLGSDRLSGRVTGTGVDAIGTISATNSATVIAGRDVTLTGATIQAGDNAAIAAGRDIAMGTATLTAAQDVQTHDGLNGGHDKVTQNLGSAIVTGGKLVMVSGRDTTLTGATVSAGGDVAMIAGGNLTVTAAKDTHTHNEQSMGGEQSHHTSSSFDEAVLGSSVNAGGNVTLAAGQNGSGNLAILGSSVSTDGTGTGGVRFVSPGDITIGSVNETHDSQSWAQTNRSGFLSQQKTTDTASSHQVIANGSTISGDTVAGAAGHDMTISGSTVAATHDVTLAAANNLTINTTQDTGDSSHFYQNVKTGLGSSGGIGVSYGTVDTKDTTHDSSVTHNGSLVGSTGGSVNLSAGANLHVTGSDLIAAQNVTGAGTNVTIDAATDTAHHDETHEVSKSGFTLAVKAPVLDAISNTVDQAHAASRSQDDRAAALHGMAAASGALDSVGTAGAAAGALANGGKPEAKIELSYGSSHNKDTYTEDSTTSKGSGIKAGGTAAFAATGNGAPGSGNVTIAGSDINANDVILAAKNQVNLLNTTNTDSTRSTNQSSSASVGVSYGTQGFGVSASMSKAHGNSNSDAAMQNNTHVTAANTATIMSGGDTNIIGSNVNGRQIYADVGGNLNIASMQDTLSSSAHQESTGGGFAISQGGGSASFSHTNANASGSYAGVNEQAGIQAGDGGFNINVKGNTDLKGAVIASDADASKNNLSTGTLTFNDIQNQSSYDAHSGGFSAGVTTGDGGANYSTHGNTSGVNGGGGAPMLSQNDSGSDSAATRSGISAGTISVTGTAKQTQDVASLNRDTSDTNGTVARLPDVNNLLDRQTDMMAAASAAGEAVSRRIGDYADLKAKDAGGDGGGWQEGGANRAIMQAAGAALVTGLAGGNALGGAAGAGIASIAAGKLNDLSGAIADSDPTGNPDMNKALGNIVANAIATGAGAAVGGNAGAFEGYNVDRFNRQLHPDEYAMAKKDAKIVAKQLGISEQEAVGRIVAELLRNSDQQTSNASGGVHDYEVRAIIGCQNLSCDGYKTDPQYANHDYNSQYIATNQQAYDAGQGQLNKGVTYNDLVKNNVKNNPASMAIAGAGMIAVGGLVAGGLPAATGMLTGGGIGAAINTGAQYFFNNGQISLVDTSLAAITGALTFGTGLLPGLLMNTGGALAGSAMKGDNPNMSMAGAAAGTVAGYAVGGKVESIIGNRINPWYRPEWVDIGNGISKYVPPSAIPSIGGTTVGAMASEGTSAGVNSAPNYLPVKK